MTSNSLSLRIFIRHLVSAIKQRTAPTAAQQYEYQKSILVLLGYREIILVYWLSLAPSAVITSLPKSIFPEFSGYCNDCYAIVCFLAFGNFPVIAEICNPAPGTGLMISQVFWVLDFCRSVGVIWVCNEHHHRAATSDLKLWKQSRSRLRCMA